MRGPRARATSDVIYVVSALFEYSVNHDGAFPSTLEALVVPDAQGFRYLNQTSVPADPWGRPYVYRQPQHDETIPFVASLGKDGRIGGKDEDADIDSVTISSP